MKDNINKIINEEINKFLLNESLTDIVYHFTNFHSLLGIAKSNKFFLRNSLTDNSKDDYMHKTKRFFMSFTRRRNGFVGYSRGLKVRLTIDGRLLNNNFESKPVDYWKDMKKNKDKSRRYNYNRLDKFDSFNETEDRLFSNSPSINNAMSYILRIDAVFDRDEWDCLETLKYIINSDFRGKLHVYNNDNDFNKLNGNEIPIDSLMEELNDARDDVDMDSDYEPIITTLMYLKYNFDIDISETLDQIGLSDEKEIINREIEDGNYQNPRQVDLYDTLEDLFSLPNKKYYEKLTKLINYLFKKNNMKNEKDINK